MPMNIKKNNIAPNVVEFPIKHCITFCTVGELHYLQFNKRRHIYFKALTMKNLKIIELLIAL